MSWGLGGRKKGSRVGRKKVRECSEGNNTCLFSRLMKKKERNMNFLRDKLNPTPFCGTLILGKKSQKRMVLTTTLSQSRKGLPARKLRTEA